MRVVLRRETGGAASNHGFLRGAPGRLRAATWRQTMPPGRAGPDQAPMQQVSDAAPTLTR